MRKLLYNQFHIENKEELKNVYELALKSKSLESDVAEVLKWSQVYYEANMSFPTKDSIRKEFKTFEFIDETFKDTKDTAEYIKDKEIQFKELYRKELAIKLLDNKLPVSDRMLTIDEISKLEFNSISNDTVISNVKDLNVKEMYKNRKGKDTGYYCGVPEIDEITGGFGTGKMVVVTAPAKSFKTSFLINTAYINLAKSGNNTLFISLEIPKDELYYKILIRHSYTMKKDISTLKLLKGRLSEEEEAILYELDRDFRENYLKSELIIMESRDIKMETISGFKSQLIDIIEKQNINTILVDYIQLFSEYQVKGFKEKFEMLNSVVGVFRYIGVTYDARIILLSQMTKIASQKAIATEGSSIDSTSVADASSLIRDSSIMISLFCNDVLKASKQIKIALLLHRDGESFTDAKNVFIVPDKFVIGCVDISYNSLMTVDESKVVVEHSVSSIDLFAED